MKERFYITFAILFVLGATKMFLWPKLWNKKAWWPKFNFWYGKLLILATLAFIGVFIWELVKFLFQKYGV